MCRRSTVGWKFVSKCICFLCILDRVCGITQRERSLSTLAQESCSEAMQRQFRCCISTFSLLSFSADRWRDSVKWIVPFYITTSSDLKTSLVSGDRLGYWNQTLHRFDVCQLRALRRRNDLCVQGLIHALFSFPLREGIAPPSVRFFPPQLPPS